jgi:hypothetical protein
MIGFPAAAPTVTNASKVAIYPNPVSNELTVNAGSGSYNTLNISSIIGQVLISQEFNTQAKVNVSSLPSGIYYVTLRGEDGVNV